MGYMHKLLLLGVALSVSTVASPQLLEEAQAAERAFQRGDYATTFEELNKARRRAQQMGDFKEISNVYQGFRRLAERGYAPAQTEVGIFVSSNGAQSQMEEAVSWFRKAAEQSDARGQNNLGKAFANGWGVVQDEQSAAHWYRKAAEQGHAEAQVNLARIVRKNSTASASPKEPLTPTQGANDFGTNLEIQRQQSATCLANLKGDPMIMSIHNKVPVDSSKPATLEQLGNQSKPTAREKSALSFMVAEWERCMDMAVEWRKQNYAPQVDALYVSYRVELKSVFADLYGGKLTFGDVAKARAKMDLDYKFKLIAIASELQAKSVAEEQRRQAVDLQNRNAEAQRRYAEAQNQQQRDAELQRQKVAQQQMEQQQAQLRLAQEETQRQLQQQQKNAKFQQLMHLQQFIAPLGASRLPPGAYRLEPPPINCRSVMSGNVVQTQCQ